MESPCVHCRNHKVFNKLAYLHLDVLGKDICQLELRRNFLTDCDKLVVNYKCKKDSQPAATNGLSNNDDKHTEETKLKNITPAVPTGILIFDRQSPNHMYNCQFCKKLISGRTYQGKTIKGFEEFSEHMIKSHQTIVIVKRSSLKEWAKATDTILDVKYSLSSEATSRLSQTCPLTRNTTKKQVAESCINFDHKPKTPRSYNKIQKEQSERKSSSKVCLKSGRKRKVSQNLLKNIFKRGIARKVRNITLSEVTMDSLSTFGSIKSTEEEMNHDSESETGSIIDIGCEEDEPFNSPIEVDADVESVHEDDSNKMSMEFDDQNTIAVVPVLIDDDATSESVSSENSNQDSESVQVSSTSKFSIISSFNLMEMSDTIVSQAEAVENHVFTSNITIEPVCDSLGCISETQTENETNKTIAVSTTAENKSERLHLESICQTKETIPVLKNNSKLAEPSDTGVSLDTALENNIPDEPVGESLACITENQLENKTDKDDKANTSQHVHSKSTCKKTTKNNLASKSNLAGPLETSAVLRNMTPANLVFNSDESVDDFLACIKIPSDNESNGINKKGTVSISSTTTCEKLQPESICQTSEIDPSFKSSSTLTESSDSDTKVSMDIGLQNSTPTSNITTVGDNLACISKNQLENETNTNSMVNTSEKLQSESIHETNEMKTASKSSDILAEPSKISVSLDIPPENPVPTSNSVIVELVSDRLACVTESRSDNETSGIVKNSTASNNAVNTSEQSLSGSKQRGRKRKIVNTTGSTLKDTDSVANTSEQSLSGPKRRGRKRKIVNATETTLKDPNSTSTKSARNTINPSEDSPSSDSNLTLKNQSIIKPHNLPAEKVENTTGSGKLLVSKSNESCLSTSNTQTGEHKSAANPSIVTNTNLPDSTELFAVNSPVVVVEDICKNQTSTTTSTRSSTDTFEDQNQNTTTDTVHLPNPTTVVETNPGVKVVKKRNRKVAETKTRELPKRECKSKTRQDAKYRT